MKKIWITALDKDKQPVEQLLSTARKYGLSADGHFFEDQLEKMAWAGASEKLSDPGISLWIIAGSAASLTKSVRYGLTLTLLAAQRSRPDLSTLWIDTAGGLEQTDLPGVFADTQLLPISHTSLGAKLAAMANMPAKNEKSLFRLCVHANPGIGVWFEIGPGNGMQWSGVVLGTSGGEIKCHGVGDRGKLPEKCVLEYPLKGMEIEAGDERYISWGIKNVLSHEDSYYVKVDGTVQSLIFGELPSGSEADLHVLNI